MEISINSYSWSQWCHPSISPSVTPSPALNFPQHQGLFQWVSSQLLPSHYVPDSVKHFYMCCLIWFSKMLWVGILISILQMKETEAQRVRRLAQGQTASGGTWILTLRVWLQDSSHKREWSFVVVHSVRSDSSWPHGLQHAKLPCPSLLPEVCSNSSFLASESFPMSQLFWCWSWSSSTLATWFKESSLQAIYTWLVTETVNSSGWKALEFWVEEVSPSAKRWSLGCRVGKSVLECAQANWMPLSPLLAPHAFRRRLWADASGWRAIREPGAPPMFAPDWAPRGCIQSWCRLSLLAHSACSLGKGSEGCHYPGSLHLPIWFAKPQVA